MDGVGGNQGRKPINRVAYSSDNAVVSSCWEKAKSQLENINKLGLEDKKHA